MMAGVVATPKIDLSNKELIESHLYAIYLAKVGLQEINDSLMDIIDDANPAELPLREEVTLKLQLNAAAESEIKAVFKKVIFNLKVNGAADYLMWLNDDWINAKISSAPNKFDRALDRWRKLYKSAQRLLSDATRIIEGGLYTRDSEQMKEALRSQAQGIR